MYIAKGDEITLVFLSPEPYFDFYYLQSTSKFREFELLSHPLPVGIAACLLKKIREVVKEKMDAFPASTLSPSFMQDLCRRELSSVIYPPGHESGRQLAEEASASRMGFAGTLKPDAGVQFDCPRADELEELEGVLSGRLLNAGEIARILRLLSGAEKRRLWRTLQVLCLRGRAALLPALYPYKGAYVRCQRCGWEGAPYLRNCDSCRSSTCCSCPECLVMGGLTLCSPLYTRLDQDLAPAYEASNSFSERFSRKGLLLLGRLVNFFLCGRSAWLQESEREEIICTPLVFGGKNFLQKGLKYKRQSGVRAGSLLNREKLRGGGFRLEVELTPPQKDAVKKLLDFAAGKDLGCACLVWAACGAGKTEVSFPLIAYFLARGKKVLFATPRRDVVLEIAPRLGRAFGKEKVVALYGGSGCQGTSAPLTVATTHQTLRFRRNFDLVILDEGDAYPYPGSRMLRFGVERARRPDGLIVYLTATPAPWMLAGTGRKNSRVNIIKIPARPHGFPLPEPQFLKVEALYEGRSGHAALNEEVLRLIGETVGCWGIPLFVFVPTVEMTGVVGRALRSAAGKPPLESFSPGWVEWSHAGDREREVKKERFFAGEFPVFVTTTIMERGVTVPRVHVLVIDAHHPVFDAPALVQIAGRCGRSPSYPTGDVWFVAPHISRAMKEAVSQIRSFNKEAAAAGYLRSDYADALKKILIARVQGEFKGNF